MIVLYIFAIIVLIFGFVVFRGAPYVPSHRRVVVRAFEELYPLSSKDILVDVGSGDGIILRLAASKGARAIGYELNPILVIISRLLSRHNARIATQLADFWLVDLPADTTIVYAFSVTRDMPKLVKKMQRTANRVGHPVYFMCYGAEPEQLEPLKKLNAHSLYLFEPV